jgi:iron complex transport system ATP-binding protein
MMIHASNITRVDAGRVRVQPTSLQLEAGTVTAIVGPNGAGKSTLLSMLSGELSVSSGTVLIDDRSIDSYAPMELARTRAVMAQDTPSVFAFAVRDVVAWGRHCWQRTPAHLLDQQYIDAAMSDQNITELADRPITSLSGGERTRTHLARVLAQDTPLLFLDEADADLDLAGRSHLDDLIKRQRSDGRTVVLVSHDLGRMRELCDTVIAMRNGEVIHVASASDVLQSHVIAEVFCVDQAIAQRALGG